MPPRGPALRRRGARPRAHRTVPQTGPHDSLLIVMLLDDRRDRATRADAVPPLPRRLLRSVFFEEVGSEGNQEDRPDLEDVPDLDGLPDLRLPPALRPEVSLFPAPRSAKS